MFQSGDYAVYAVTSPDGADKGADEGGWTEYQWEVEIVTQDAVVLRETHIDYFDADDESETMSYLSDWSCIDRRLLAYRFEGREPLGFVYDAFSLHWVPTDLAVGEPVMVGGLEFAVAGITTAMVGADNTTLDAWELVYEDEILEASFFYDTERGMWLAAELAITIDGIENTEAFVLVDTNVPLQGRKMAAARRSYEMPEAAPLSESEPQTAVDAAAKGDAGNELVITPAYQQTHVSDGRFTGRGEMITSGVIVDPSGHIVFDLLGVADGPLESLFTRTKPRGRFQEDIWIPCEGLYQVEIRGHADFAYGIGATDLSGIIPLIPPVLPVTRARFNANVGYVIQGGGVRHEDSKPIIDNELITNLDFSDYSIQLPGYQAPGASGARRKFEDKSDDIFGRVVDRPVTLTTTVHLKPGTYGVVSFAEAGLNIGQGGPLTQTVAEIQGAFTVQDVTVRWPYGLPPVLHAGGPDWTGPPETGEGCLELSVNIIAGLFADGETVMSARHKADVPLKATMQPGGKMNMDMTYYEGEAVFEVSDLVTVYQEVEGCNTIITPRHGIVSIGMEVWEDDVRLYIGAPQTPGIDVYMDCPGVEPLEMQLDTWGVFIHNYLVEMMGPGMGGFELKPQPWHPNDEWVAKLEEVRDETYTGVDGHLTDVEISLRW